MATVIISNPQLNLGDGTVTARVREGRINWDATVPIVYVHPGGPIDLNETRRALVDQYWKLRNSQGVPELLSQQVGLIAGEFEDGR